jgi:hypothetical protein
MGKNEHCLHNKEDRIMALNELQWGRIFALAWRNKNFRDTLEKDPAAALMTLRDNPNFFSGRDPDTGKDSYIPPFDVIREITPLPGDDEIVDPNRIVYPEDFGGMQPTRLKEIIQDEKPVAMSIEYWFWGEDKGVATTNDEPDTISLRDWGRIYARLYVDERIHLPHFKSEFPDLYHPKKDYSVRFRLSPAAVVNAIAAEFSLRDPQFPVPALGYKPDHPRLFALKSKPNWGDEQLEEAVKTGTVSNMSFRRCITKCC